MTLQIPEKSRSEYGNILPLICFFFCAKSIQHKSRKNLPFTAIIDVFSLQCTNGKRQKQSLIFVVQNILRWLALDQVFN